MKRALGAFSILAAALALGTPAYASLSCTGGTYFSETGNTGGIPEDAEGCVTIGAGTITVKVDDTVPTITQLSNLVDGFDFTLSGGTPGSISLTSVSVPLTFVDCINQSTCQTTATFKNGGSGSGVPSPYEWALTTSTNSTVGPKKVNFSDSTPGVLAGGGSLHPGAITNSSILGESGVSAVSGNGPHNDLLLGSSTSPVVFNFSFSGGTTPTGVSAMDFYFGTNGDKQIGTKGSSTVPEPTSILLLGTALAFASMFLRKRLGA